MVNQINNNRSSQSLRGVNGYDSFKNAGNSSRDDDSSDFAGGSRVDDAKGNVAALRESIVGSRTAAGVGRGNDVTHNFDDFDKSFL